MNIRLYTLVLKKHWLLLFIGFSIAIVLSAYAAFQISFSPPKATWKLQRTYGVSSVLLVTQPGFPVGRADIVENGSVTSAADSVASTFADPSRYDYLAGLYAQLATSDQVVDPVLGKHGFIDNGRLVLDGGKTSGTFTATQLSDAAANTTLPFIEIDAEAHTPAAAVEIGKKVTDSLIAYVTKSESSVGISTKQRVILTVAQTPDQPRIVKGRPFTLPAVILVLCAFTTLALAFLLENFRAEENRASALESSGVATVRQPAVLRPSNVTRRPHSETEQSASQH